ncbi:tumor necrosis factor receptor superfamily member 1A [Brachyistius frenatus]|uniref:tumor necrosis factor receptor superfamily member 1A n=1 Tax=Brachyistius frenatus TaxID=100188 RepID=UPI0037E95A7F
MDFMLGFLLIVALISIGQGDIEGAEQTTGSSQIKCLAGNYCEHKSPTGNCTCTTCGDGTFTDRENTASKCSRCRSCLPNEKIKKDCTISTNRECECKDGYYFSKSYNSCWKCPSCEETDDKRNIDERKNCPKYQDCKTEYTTTPTTQSPTGANNQTVWLFLVVVVGALLWVFWLLLLFKYLLKNPPSCPCWSANKDLELTAQDPKLNEQCSHQGGGTTTQISNISEETPMMSPSQSAVRPEHPAHISLLLPNSDNIAARQAEHSGHWPAIILYAIIKEVPLRRWKEFLRLLSVPDQQMERVDLEAGLGLGSMERQYQMLRLWSQRSSAGLNDVFSALHYMDLSGCAQLLQESLEKLQWRPEPKQGFTA